MISSSSVFLISLFLIFQANGSFCLHPTRKGGSAWWAAEFIYKEEEAVGRLIKSPVSCSRFLAEQDDECDRRPVKQIQPLVHNRRMGQWPKRSSQSTSSKVVHLQKNRADMQKSISQNKVQRHQLKSQIPGLRRDHLTDLPCILQFLPHLNPAKDDLWHSHQQTDSIFPISVVAKDLA